MRGFTLRRLALTLASAALTLGGLAGVMAAPASAAPAAPAGHASTTHHITSLAELNRALRAGGLIAIKAHPDTAGGPYHVCLWNASSFCWQMNGSGSQVTISDNSSNYANMTLFDGGSANQFFKFQDGNGKCIYLGSGPSWPLMLGSNSCSSDYSSNSTQAFYLTGSGTGPYNIESAFTGSGGGGLVMVFNDLTGKPVWVNSQAGYVKWGFI